MSKCLITGTFDPLTIGHEAVIKRALTVFDHVAVAILVNPDKETMFSVEERIRMVKSVFGEKVEVFYSDGWAVDAAKETHADVLVRGIRGEGDLSYEEEMARYNRDHGVETVFFFAEAGLTEVTSTAVRTALEAGTDVKDYLSEDVYRLVTEYRGK
ncbi:MAG: pantetheine-phosphate adenylyltransferase [Clostridia bacterium]|nr:pantetheine-phosphate adenylyltransferase [Clostridia bacterium]